MGALPPPQTLPPFGEKNFFSLRLTIFKSVPAPIPRSLELCMEPTAPSPSCTICHPHLCISNLTPGGSFSVYSIDG